MASSNKKVVKEIYPVLLVYDDGTVERPTDPPYAPPSLQGSAATHGVSSKDVAVSPDFLARLYLPPNTGEFKKLPVLVYFHGGGFCFDSVLSTLHHAFLNSLVSEAKVVAVAVEYRQAPDHYLPTAYEDCWTAIQWVASHSLPISNTTTATDPWLLNHGDFNRFYIGGDSAGGNIVHNMALRAGKEDLNGNLKLSGGYLTHGFFWGSKPVEAEASKIANREKSIPYQCWMLAYPSAVGGIDNPMINPFVDGAPSLAGLGIPRLLVSVAEKEELRERGVEYYKAVKESGWKGDVELAEDLGEGHYFHILCPDSPSTKRYIKRVASFINM